MYIIYYYHSNLFLQWNLVRLLSILWWKTSARWSGHYNGRLISNCLQRHRTTNSCLSSLWIAIERLGLTWSTRCLQWNSNSDTIHTLSHSITRGTTMKSHCWLLNIEKWKIWRLEKKWLFNINCTKSCGHLSECSFCCFQQSDYCWTVS